MEARLRHSVDGDGWKAVARAAAQEAISEFLPDARESLSAGKPLAEVAATLTDDARERTREILFNRIRSTGMMTPKTRIRYCPTLPGYRRRTYSLTMADVPGELLDVEELVPDLGEMVAQSLAGEFAGGPENN